MYVAMDICRVVILVLIICQAGVGLKYIQSIKHFVPVSHYNPVILNPSSRYRTFVSEDAGPNTLVATVLAKDPDGDGITYSITAGNEEGNFVIDSQKGDLLLISSLTLYFHLSQ